MLAKLFLLRHGRTSLAGKFVGSTDVELSGVGIKQIQSIRDILLGQKLEKIYCSPMKRCRQTAEILDLGEKICFVDELKEIDFGRWEGLTYPEIERQDPAMIRNWMDKPEEFCFPEGECRGDFLERIDNWKKEFLKLDEGKTLVITHGGVIRHLICLILGISINNYLLFQVGDGALTTLDCFGERGVLTGFNLRGLSG